jgi:tRNA A-37 threonylcarbamoyl transferase component Bud32/tetratricopeptide (TPR) repeat protein
MIGSVPRPELADRLRCALADRYAVERELGHGGMATVYLARDLRHERRVAIKALHPEVASALGEDRFRREIRVAAGLQHPHILPVYDSGADAGLLWFTMPYVDGQSLRQRLGSAGRLAIGEAVSVLAPIARALAYAHARGVIHRDLKPDNVLLSEESVFLADFGIAKPLDGATGQFTTTAGMVVGTPAYMAPEQAADDPGADYRVDIYAFGVLAYELLAGETPFANLPLGRMLAAHATLEPEPLERRRPEVSTALAAVIARCLRKDSRARWPSAGALHEAVQAAAPTGVTGWRVSAPTSARAVAPPPEGDPLERGRAAFTRTAWREAYEGLSAADVGELLEAEDLERLAEAAWWLSHGTTAIRVRERAYRAYLQRDELTKAAAVALALAEDHFHRLAGSVGQGWLRRAERHLESLPEAAAHGWLSRLQCILALEAEGRPDQAMLHAAAATAVATRVGDTDLAMLALQDRGRALVALGRLSEGMALIDEAMTAVTAGELTPRTAGRAYCNMLSTCERLGDIGRAAEWYDAAQGWSEPYAASGYPGICRVRRASILRLRGALAEAEHEARRAADELADFLTDVAGDAFYELGDIRLRSGDLAGAGRMFDEAHARGRDPQPGLALLRLAEGKPAAARSMIERAVGEPGKTALDRGRLLPSVVEIRVAAGDPAAADEAAAELEAVSATFPTPAFVAAAALARGRVELARDRAADAVTQLRRAGRIYAELELPLELAQTRLLLARAYREQGNADDAELEERSARTAIERVQAGAR